MEKNQSNAKSCKVTTIANTNHFRQNLKKRYLFSLAIVVPQSERHLHSGDRLFEWPKLLKKMTNESTYGEIHNTTSTQTCVLWCTQINNLIGWTCIVCVLFSFTDYSTISNILRRFFNGKLMRKRVVLDGLKIFKTQFVPGEL